MVKVITYGTFDLLHYGHIRLLERAKALGDYLIVGVTSDDFDRSRGKINVQQSLMERMEAVRATGLADKIIVEEYEGQKIDDIKQYGVDIFAIGSDWKGKFDYLNEFCQVIYLPRTQGISSSQIRQKERQISLGIVGSSAFVNKLSAECRYVNGIRVSGLYSEMEIGPEVDRSCFEFVTDDYDTLLDASDAVYVHEYPAAHYGLIVRALKKGKHVICSSPMALTGREYKELTKMARDNQCVLMDGIKTAYSTAYQRLILLLKSGHIGRVVSVDATCTSLVDVSRIKDYGKEWGSITDWGPTALLPVFQIAGTEYRSFAITTHRLADTSFDTFTKIDFTYDSLTATIKVGNGIKSEGEMVVAGTLGYIYVPAPWWKTDYFEIRYENQTNNRRYFYQLDGEGIRYELVCFAKAISSGSAAPYSCIDGKVSGQICQVMEAYYQNQNMKFI